MKQKLLIVLVLGLLLALLAGLNAASYVQKEKTPDNEGSPHRSTYYSGPTGTQAFYTLLSETGRKVERWQRPPSELVTAKGDKPAVFVVVGSVKRQFTPDEYTDLLKWVADGGRLVVIDRSPDPELTTTTSNWKIAVNGEFRFDLFGTDPSDQTQMVGKASAAKPTQASVFASEINAIQPSQFATSISFSRINKDGSDDGEAAPPPPARRRSDMIVSAPTTKGPVVLFASEGKNLVVEAPFGSGHIVYVSDPYFVTNAGIALVDNAQLGIDLVSVNGGSIAFDEFHQGYGGENQFAQFFAGTPVIAIFFQAAALVGFVFYSQSRRFARPVPEAEPDRLSKLEYVSAMSELQQRMRAYDLAMENLYGDFRRRVCRLLGLVAVTAKYHEIAAAISERVGLDRQATSDILYKCEDIIRGEPTNNAEMMRLTSELREIEKKLGLQRAGR